MSLTPPPTAPTPSMPAAEFDVAAYQLASWHSTNVTELGALQTEVAANADIAEAAAAVKNTDQYKGLWASGTTYTVGQSVKYSNSFWLANRTSTGVTPVEGLDWSQASLKGLPISIDSGNVTFATAPANGSVRWALSMGTQYELLFVGGSSSIHAVVWDKTNKVFGSPVLVRTASWDLARYGAAIAISTTQAVLVTCPATTAMEAVCLTITGTSISVGAAATATLAGNLSGINDIQLVGTSVVIAYDRATSVAGIRALAISGSTVTIGPESTLSGSGQGYLHVVSPTVVLSVSCYPPNLYAKPFTVSGSTLTGGTEASTAGTAINHTGVLSTGRWFVVYENTTKYGCVISVSGTTASISTSSLGMTTGAVYAWPMSSGGQVLVAVNNAGVNVLTDSSGTAVAGTAKPIGPFGGGRFDGEGITNVTGGLVYRYGVSGYEPTLSVVGSTPTNNSASPVVPNVKCTRTSIGVQSATQSLGGNLGSGVLVQLCKATGADSFLIPSGAARVWYSSVGLSSAAVAWAADPAGYSTSATTYNLARLEIA